MLESINYSLSIAGTGGFAIKNSGLAEYSPYIQNVIAVFMVLFGIKNSWNYFLYSRL
jgi:trk system potassium uptake protein TrkH